ncbi:hypothetical protein SADUNF_Sadunf10G0166100 [Salix dunnii]|uniref:Uncharacterized protein n=1 Tax=Salix dunnii TaxID=1413687 RepID=A0A835JUA9_9ROSI|nr:hypothetical protein SADUNF_Sadunf10G0166100 [Salix dunnii]
MTAAVATLSLPSHSLIFIRSTPFPSSRRSLRLNSPSTPTPTAHSPLRVKASFVESSTFQKMPLHIITDTDFE